MIPYHEARTINPCKAKTHNPIFFRAVISFTRENSNNLKWRGSVRYQLVFIPLLIIAVLYQSAYAGDEPYIPDVLQPWVEWVLHDKEEQLTCVPRYDRAQTLYCAWPTVLELKLHDKGGEFRQDWLIHHKSRIALPGNISQWPQEVLVDGKPPLITERDKVPTVELSLGSHAIKGRFAWKKLPEFLKLPANSGLVSLMVNENPVPFPHLDTTGRLWLKRKGGEEKIENRLKLESFRLLDDTIPAQVVLFLSLDVAGAARELTLGPLYDPKDFTPLSVTSKLPARLEQDGKMRIQVRPGRYNVYLKLRHAGPLRQMAFRAVENAVWPRHEIWSFRAQPDLRLVEIKEVSPIDPLQTSMPKEWQSYPAYRLEPGDTMILKELKRGDPEPSPDQLKLSRNLWLRFDGSGFSLQDRISGKKNTNWRLEIDPLLNLGRVAVDGKERFITKRTGSEKAGVELRNGLVDLTADSVYNHNISSLPATGWDHDFQKVTGNLHLPPGWHLLHAKGIDNIPGTWVKRWTLLDFFIVLIFTIALAKLFSKPLAVIAFLTLVLTYHEPDAPRYVWLALLAGFALLRYLPDGKFKNGIKIYQFGVALALLVIVIPYSIQALRVGIYPQLAKPWTSMTEYSLRQEVSRSVAPQEVMMEAVQVQEMDAAPGRSDKAYQYKGKKSRMATVGATGGYSSPQVMQHDPKALTQTGPGMPKWPPFATVSFSWSGPVTPDQMVAFYLIGPRTNLSLAFSRVFLILFLALGMFSIGYRKGQGFALKGLASIVILPLFCVFISSGSGWAREIPSEQMLGELQERLLREDTCFPSCADISRVDITINANQLVIDAEYSAELDTAVPVPGHVKHWLPQHIQLDDMQVAGLRRSGDTLWLMVPQGHHVVQLRGNLRKQSTLQLPFPLKPHRLSIKADGWSVEGLHSDGTFDAQLQFKRIAGEGRGGSEILETGILPSFASVERTLLLGLVWKVKTKVRRLSPKGAAIVIDIPLVPGESVITEGVRVEGGVAKINMHADQIQIFWESFLQPADTIVLEHKATSDWTEIWKVDVSPIFHLDYEGIPVILHKTGARWYPTWHPWPKEKIVLEVSRPAGVEGQTLTFEKSHLVLRPGKKTTAATLHLFAKSSQGGQHSILLPEGAVLQEVKLRGRILPIRQDGRRLALPIHPGEQKFELKWLEAKGISTRYQSTEIDLGMPSVNASVDIQLSRSRWPLWVGGQQLVGPAVLFWSALIVIVLVAFGLSKTSLTPLKFHHWFLLGIGMSMSNPLVGIVIAGWLLCLDLRQKADKLEGGRFNSIQVLLAVLTLVALTALVYAISRGLLGHPDMNIVGNGSRATLLRWYHDVSENILPKAWVLSIPMYWYRIVMLLWALWISSWLVGILKWGWQNYTSPQIWRKGTPRKKKGRDKNKDHLVET